MLVEENVRGRYMKFPLICLDLEGSVSLMFLSAEP